MGSAGPGAALANEWGQQPAADGGQAAGEWNQGQSANDWNQQAQAQQGWDQQGQAQAQQGWDQHQQGWDQQQPQQQWQGGAGATYAPVQPGASGGSLFDFSFKAFSLPKSASIIWIITIVALFVEWLFGFIALFTNDYAEPGAMTIISTLIGGLLLVVTKAFLVRVLLEIGIGVVKLVGKSDAGA